ncbi:argininosuccinate synthase [Anaerotignum propionicum]|uniref:Argininosuccinate synthase n=1 Tax=Anaerotignum propionicum DSM 1682 TaxID=991789 RepID=A0A110A7P5_ANAPI|nr:argininosuccinate synthase [Anaerotignum propionicum]AMJ42468.1 argininosuccinate synthase [Anaerotignum propionicum DSM 1682]SHE33828.1 argininosuccinate synthase [[Clostridium] propionicum DSM 1682] [Anaerotignum propionicum DSM 1682]
MKEKIVLAYSGGLDTSVIIPWLKENYDAEVIAVCGDVGQGKETDGLEEKALRTGASKLYIEDLTEEFITDAIYPCIKANAVYEGKYLLGTSMARPIIAKKLVEIAKKEGATAICHGATGKGNDQVRFELTIKALAPELKIIAPWRLDTWGMESREDEMAYLEARGIPFPVKKDDSYSRDRNIWHLSHEGLELEDPANEPNYEHLLQMGVSPENAPDVPEYVTVDFEAGIPVAVNGEKLSPIALLTKLNEIGGKNGIGIIDICENRVVGMKSRGVYETPGGAILYYAHRELEYLCLDKKTLSFNEVASNKLTELVYSGEWFTPLREALCAYFDHTNETVTGSVKMKLYKGNIISAGATSPYSLYNESIASFTTGELYNHKDADGFINLFGLSMKVRAMMLQNNQNK